MSTQLKNTLLTGDISSAKTRYYLGILAWLLPLWQRTASGCATGWHSTGRSL